ncbi:MAG: hypothetical protein AAF550_01730 [Myxococcota bacterium]
MPKPLGLLAEEGCGHNHGGSSAPNVPPEEAVAKSLKRRLALLKQPASSVDVLFAPYTHVRRVWAANRNNSGRKWIPERTGGMKLFDAEGSRAHVIMMDGGDELAQLLVSMGLHEKAAAALQSFVIFPLFIPPTWAGLAAAEQEWREVYEHGKEAAEAVKQARQNLGNNLKKTGGWTLGKILDRALELIGRDDAITACLEEVPRSADQQTEERRNEERDRVVRAFHVAAKAIEKAYPSKQTTDAGTDREWRQKYQELKTACRSEPEGSFAQAILKAIDEYVNQLDQDRANQLAQFRANQPAPRCIRIDEYTGEELKSPVDPRRRRRRNRGRLAPSQPIRTPPTERETEFQAQQSELDDLVFALCGLETARAKQHLARIEYVSAPAAALGTGFMLYAIIGLDAAAISTLAGSNTVANAFLSGVGWLLPIGQLMMAIHGLSNVATGVVLEKRLKHVADSAERLAGVYRQHLGDELTNTLLATVERLRQLNRSRNIYSGAALAVGQLCMVLGGDFFRNIGLNFALRAMAVAMANIGALGLPSVMLGAGTGLTFAGILGRIVCDMEFERRFLANPKEIPVARLWRDINEAKPEGTVKEPLSVRTAKTISKYYMRSATCYVWLRIWYWVEHLLRLGGEYRLAPRALDSEFGWVQYNSIKEPADVRARVLRQVQKELKHDYQEALRKEAEEIFENQTFKNYFDDLLGRVQELRRDQISDARSPWNYRKEVFDPTNDYAKKLQKQRLELIFVAGGLQIEARREDQAENAPLEDHKTWREEKLKSCIDYATNAVASSQSIQPETQGPLQAPAAPDALQKLHGLVKVLGLRGELHQEMGGRAYLRKAYGRGEENPHNAVYDRETYAAGVQIPLPLFDTTASFLTGSSHLLPEIPGTLSGRETNTKTAYMFKEREFLGLRPSMRRDIDVRRSKSMRRDLLPRPPVVRSPIVQESYVRAATKALFRDYSARVLEGLGAYLEILLLVAVVEALETETVAPSETRSATPLPTRWRKPRWRLHPNRPRDASPQANTPQANAARVTPKEWTLALDSLRWFGFWYRYNRYLRHIATERRVEEEKLFELLVSRAAYPYSKGQFKKRHAHKEIHAHILRPRPNDQLRPLFDCIEEIRKSNIQLQKQFGRLCKLRSDDWTGKTLLTPAGQWLSRLRALTLFACLKFRPGASVEGATDLLTGFWEDTESKPVAKQTDSLQRSKWAASLEQVYDLAIELPGAISTGARNPRRDALDQEMYQRAFRRGHYGKQNPCAAWFQAPEAQAHPSSAPQCFQDKKFFLHLKFLRDSVGDRPSIRRQGDYNSHLIPWPWDYFSYASNTDLHSGLHGRPLDFRRYFFPALGTIDSSASHFIEATEELLLRSLERVSIGDEADSWAKQLTTLQRRFAAHVREQMTAKVIPLPQT